MGFEGSAFLGDLGEILEAEDLKTAAVGEDGPVPVHEFMQAAEAADQLMAGPDVEMVGVAEDDLGAQLLEVFRGHALDRGLGAHRHEDRGLHRAVQGAHLAAPGRAIAGFAVQGIGRTAHHRAHRVNSSSMPLRARAAMRMKSSGLKGLPSAVHWVSTQRPSPVMTKLASTSAVESSA